MTRIPTRTFSSDSAINAYQFELWFDTNGAADPVSFSGNLLSVTRLTSDGAIPFYRCRFGLRETDRPQIIKGTGSVMGDLDAGDLLDARVPYLLQMPVAAAPAKEIDVDVVVTDNNVTTNSVAAGARVSVTLLADENLPI